MERRPSRPAPASLVRLRNSKRIPPADVKALFRAAGWTEDIAAYSPRQIRKLLRDSHLVCTAWHQGRLVGFASAVSDGVLCGLVQNLAVHPDYRRQGLGTRLLRQLAATMGRQGIPCLYALGPPRRGARSFFGRVGFHALKWKVFLRHTR